MPMLPYLTKKADICVSPLCSFALVGEDAPLGVDALAHMWPNALLNEFLPMSLIGPKLQKVLEFRHSLILIAPFWP